MMPTIELIQSWVQELGQFQLKHFRSGNLNIESKSGASDLVTDIDKKSEEFLHKKIRESFPDHTIMGEEMGRSSGNSSESTHAEENLWIIDPIDGTNNFISGIPIWVISIAFQIKGETQLGVVYSPYLNELYHAEKGKGAFLNECPLRVSKKTDLNESIVGTGFPYDKDTHANNNLKQFTKILPQVRGVRRLGAAAYDLCLVAAGHLDAYWEFNLNIWDVAAGFLLLNEAGGTQVPLRADRKISFLAANEVLVSKLKEQLD